MAEQRGVDLVEISPNAEPPVCRLIDYSKFIYQQKKHQKQSMHSSSKILVTKVLLSSDMTKYSFFFKKKRHLCPAITRFCSAIILIM